MGVTLVILQANMFMEPLKVAVEPTMSTMGLGVLQMYLSAPESGELLLDSLDNEVRWS